MLADRGAFAGKPKPPASWVGVNPRGNSSSASGFPPVSSTIRSSTRSSSGAGKMDSNSDLASRCPNGSTRSSGRRVSALPSSRVANTSAIFSANSRRATNMSARADPASSHCASSTTVSSGPSSVASDDSPKTASPTRKGLGGGPEVRPKATPRASRCGCGSRSSSSRKEEHSCWSAAKGSSISPSTPLVLATRYSCPASIAYSSSAVLPTPGSPWTTKTPPSPPRAPSSKRSSTARSRLRPTRCPPRARTCDGRSPSIVEQ